MKYMINENGIDREMTKAEQDAHIAWESANIAEAQAKQTEIDEKQAAKLSAIAKLEALGLTEDEAKAIIG